MTARTIHMLCTYWGLVMMSVHLGMHISQMTARMKLKNKVLIWSLRISFGVVGAAGMYEFISLKFPEYLVGKILIFVLRIHSG